MGTVGGGGGREAAVWRGDDAAHLYSEGYRFKSRPQHKLSFKFLCIRQFRQTNAGQTRRETQIHIYAPAGFVPAIIVFDADRTTNPKLNGHS